MRIISVVGHKNAGKTTLLVALAREFHRRGKRVAAIKHTAQAVEVDRPGTDSWRYFNEGLAGAVLVASPELRIVFERQPDSLDAEQLASRHFADRDLVLVEGFETSDLPKIEIHRQAVGPHPLTASEGIPGKRVAIVTDCDVGHPGCPVLKFTDTMWLNLLVALAWDHAKVIEAA